MLAQKLLRRDPRAAVEQGGWLDIRSVMGYSHDAPEYRGQPVKEMDDLASTWTQGTPQKSRKPRKTGVSRK
jgi:hypothetical protein